MKKNLSYYIEKNMDTGEEIYIEYNKIEGFEVTPKTKKEDAIEVSKIIIASPKLAEKVIKKKIEIKLRILISMLNEIDIDNDEAGSEGIKKSLLAAERLRIAIVNKYLDYVGHEFANLSLKKLEIIINELRLKLYSLNERKQKYNLYYYNNQKYNEENKDYEYEEETKKGRAR